MKRLALMTAICLLFTGSAMAATTADIIFVVDESGSMSTEHAWIPGMAASLETALSTVSVTGNRYALVGFGSSNHGGALQHAFSHTLDSDSTPEWGTASDLSSPTPALVAQGGWEDGWEALHFTMDNYSFRPGAAAQIILITDEARYNSDATYTYDNTLAKITGTTLNAVVNTYMYDGSSNRALGVDSKVPANAYIADGSGDYTTVTGGYASLTGDTYYSTDIKPDYIDMAWATGGAAWDLNMLRNSDSTNLWADSFTKAFVAIKVGEIQDDPGYEPPVPGAVLLGLIGLGYAGRKLRRFV